MANYQESTSGTLPFYNTQVEDLLNLGKQALITSQGQTTPQQSVAGFTPDQLQAFNLAKGNLGNWQPAIQSGLGALSQGLGYTQGAVGSAQFDPNQVSQYLNPYLGGVVDEIARLGNKNFTESIIPGISSQYGGLGQYGSARQALALGKAGADTQLGITGQQKTALMDAYNNAMNQYGNWAQLGSQTGISAAQNAGSLGQQYGNLGQQQSQLGVVDYGTLSNVGQTQQQLSQTQLNTGYQNTVNQQQYPWQNLNNYKGLFGVNTPQSSSSWSTQLKRGGLVRFAEGGRVKGDGWDEINSRTKEEQPWRDQLRRLLLLDEFSTDPEDQPLLETLKNMGIDDPQEFLPRNLRSKSSTPPVMLAAADTGSRTSIPTPAPGVDRNKLLEQIMGGRQDLMSEVDKALQPVPEPPILSQLGRSMLESASQGPANYGQLIGRAGAAFYGNEDTRVKGNEARELAKLKLKEQITPELGKLPMSSVVGANEKYEFRTGKDGSIWGISNLDPTKKTLVQEGSYTKEINQAAEKAADKDLEKATFDSAQQRAAARTKLIEYYNRVIGEHYAGGLSNSTDSGTKPKISSSNVPTAPPTPETQELAPNSGGARPTPGTLQTPQEVKEGEKAGEGFGKEFHDLQRDARESMGQFSRYERLGQLLNNVTTGKITPIGTEIGAWIKSAGDLSGFEWAKNIDPNLPNKEAAQALMGEMALQLRNPQGGAGMPGAMSDKDREFLIKMTPSLSTTEGGIKMMMETQKKLTQRSVDVARLAREYRAKNPRKTFDEGFYEYLQKWSDEHSMFGTSSGSTTPPAGAKKRLMFDPATGELK